MRNQAMLTWIIPVYNGEKYLAQAIDSILRQPCGDFQIIVVDDGSTDRSLEIAKGYTDSRITVLHKENGGVSSARNMGIEHAESKYIAFLDADDVICKEAYDENIHKILQEEKYDLLSWSYYVGNQDLTFGNRKSVAPGEVECDETALDPFKGFCSFAYHHNLFDGEHAVCFPENSKYFEDVNFLFLVYCRSEKMYCVDRPWFVYRNNITSALHNTKGPDYLIDHVVPAWHWCKQQCDSTRAQDQCDIWLFANATEYIRLGCMAGIPAAKIKKALEIPEIQETLGNYSILWNGRKAIYESFLKNTRQFWWKHRIKGIVSAVSHFVARLPVMRSIYMKRKYKESIERFV